jgi:TolA-binding protein
MRERAEREKVEKEKAEREKRRRQEELARLDKKAVTYLRYAKKLIDRGQDADAKARLDEIIRDFPGTPSAEEAKRLRRDLGK